MDEKILEEPVSAASGGLNKALWTKIALGAAGVCTLGVVTVASVTKKQPSAAPKADAAEFAAAERASYQDEVKSQYTAGNAKPGWQSDTSSTLSGINDLERFAQGPDPNPDPQPAPAPQFNRTSAPPPSYFNPRPQTGQSGGGGGNKSGGSGSKNEKIRDEGMQTALNRMDPEYQSVVKHFGDTRKISSWQIGGEEYKNALTQQDLLNPVEAPLKDLYSGASSVNKNFAVKLPAGTRILAVTDQDISSDHPGYFTATIVRPFEIQGAALIMQSGTNQRDRIPVTAVKIVSKSNKEISLSGQSQMGYPGFTGQVKSHWVKRIAPAVANAAIGVGVLAMTQSGPSEGRIDTRDELAWPIVDRSIGGLQNEITRLGGDFPNTVTVKAGAQFEILLTSECEIL